MKLINIVLVCLVATLACPSALYAQNKDNNSKSRHRQEQKQLNKSQEFAKQLKECERNKWKVSGDGVDLVRRFDVNHNGILDPPEIKEARKKAQNPQRLQRQQREQRRKVLQLNKLDRRGLNNKK